MTKLPDLSMKPTFSIDADPSQSLKEHRGFIKCRINLEMSIRGNISPLSELLIANPDQSKPFGKSKSATKLRWNTKIAAFIDESPWALLVKGTIFLTSWHDTF